MNELEEEWGLVPQGGEEDRHFRIFGEELPPNLSGNIYATKRYYSNDPERSWRCCALRLRTGWHTPRKRIRVVSSRRFELFSVEGVVVRPCIFMMFGPTGRPLHGEWLRNGWRSGSLAPVTRSWCLTSGLGRPFRNTERREHRALVVLLAGELYQRDRGTPAPSEQALVGPYLDHLPGDGSDELADGEAPTVRDDKPPAAAANPG